MVCRSKGEDARAAGAHREETLIAFGLSADLVQGPTSVLDAIRRCHEILAHAPDDRGIEMAMSHALAHLHARLGQFEMARPLAARCREIAAKETGWFRANRLRVIALARAAAGDLDEAEAQARAAVEAFATTDFITFHADALLTLGDVLRAASRGAEADPVFRQALDLYRQKGSLVGIETAAARLAG